jgi:TRAP-type mannitol/chloroaromatic compound transport system substrate-binding protein
MKRRKFLTTGAGVTAGALAAPAIGHAQDTFNWRMTNAYPPQLPIYTVGPGSPDAFAERVERMSNGRLRIDHFAAGELIPALEGFDAVASGTIEMNAANSYFWAGKVPAAQLFSAVPFGLDHQGMTAWLYSGGGLDLWHEIYAPQGVIAFPLNDSGVQMTGWFRNPIESVDQFDGLKMRIPGLAGEVYSRLGVNVQLLPAGEKRGVRTGLKRRRCVVASTYPAARSSTSSAH